MEIRDATPQDAEDLARLIDLAGAGLPLYIWDGLRGADQTPLQFGALRAARDEGSFSYRNAMVAEREGTVAGMVLGYRQPDPYEVGDLGDVPEVVRPLVQLEAEAPGSWYVNALATYEKFRGRGIAFALLEHCETRAAKTGAFGLSLIVASENAGAKRLYERAGYRVVGSRPVIPYPGGTHGGEWLLMLKEIAGAR